MAKEEYKWHKFDHMPSACHQFMAIRSNIKNKSISQSLNIFCFRYRLAKSFIGINAKEVGRTKIGYEAGMKVFLAYSAYENLIDAAYKLGVENVKKKYENQIMNKELSVQLMKKTELIRFISDNLRQKDDWLKAKVEDFIRGNNNDVLFIALAIRNLYAHGVFTSTKGGVKNKLDKELYFRLADEVLKYCDKRFKNCVKLLEEKL